MSRKGLKARHPLIQKLPAMDENECVTIPCRDHCRGDDGLAERRGSREYACFVCEEVRGGGLLFRRQLAQEPFANRLPTLTFVAPLGGYSQAGEKAH